MPQDPKKDSNKSGGSSDGLNALALLQAFGSNFSGGSGGIPSVPGATPSRYDYNAPELADPYANRGGGNSDALMSLLGFPDFDPSQELDMRKKQLDIAKSETQLLKDQQEIQQTTGILDPTGERLAEIQSGVASGQIPIGPQQPTPYQDRLDQILPEIDKRINFISKQGIGQSLPAPSLLDRLIQARLPSISDRQGTPFSRASSELNQLLDAAQSLKGLQVQTQTQQLARQRYREDSQYRNQRLKQEEQLFEFRKQELQTTQALKAKELQQKIDAERQFFEGLTDTIQSGFSSDASVRVSQYSLTDKDGNPRLDELQRPPEQRIGNYFNSLVDLVAQFRASKDGRNPTAASQLVRRTAEFAGIGDITTLDDEHISKQELKKKLEETKIRFSNVLSEIEAMPPKGYTDALSKPVHNSSDMAFYMANVSAREGLVGELNAVNSAAEAAFDQLMDIWKINSETIDKKPSRLEYKYGGWVPKK